LTGCYGHHRDIESQQFLIFYPKAGKICQTFTNFLAVMATTALIKKKINFPHMYKEIQMGPVESHMRRRAS
jgi:hypothetical protein